MHHGMPDKKESIGHKRKSRRNNTLIVVYTIEKEATGPGFARGKAYTVYIYM